MTRNLLAITATLAFLVGCVDTNCEGNVDDTGSDELPVIRNIAPYGWVGDHHIWEYDDTTSFNTLRCENVNSCEVELEEPHTYKVSIRGDLFDCVVQTTTVGYGWELTLESEWTGEGICGLAPDGSYDGWDVKTKNLDLLDIGRDQVTITITQWSAVVTGSTFFYYYAGSGGTDTTYTMEGWISDDLREIYFLIIAYDDDGIEVNRLESTVTLD